MGFYYERVHGFMGYCHCGVSYVYPKIFYRCPAGKRPIGNSLIIRLKGNQDIRNFSGQVRAIVSFKCLVFVF